MIPVEDIFRHVEAEKPREACGVLGYSKGDLIYFPCKNTSKKLNEFTIDADDFIRAQLKSKIYAIVHSHLSTNGPSQADRKQADALNTLYIVACEPTKTLHYAWPLKGREYEWGVRDCFTLVSDYYKQELDIDLERQDFKEFWWTDGLDYFATVPFEMGFKEVTDGTLQVNDLILFNVMSSIINHCGVYTGQGKFIHHARNRLSCEEPLYSLWGKYKNKVLRHESLLTG